MLAMNPLAIFLLKYKWQRYAFVECPMHIKCWIYVFWISNIFLFRLLSCLACWTQQKFALHLLMFRCLGVSVLVECCGYWARDCIILFENSLALYDYPKYTHITCESWHSSHLYYAAMLPHPCDIYSLTDLRNQCWCQ